MAVRRWLAAMSLCLALVCAVAEAQDDEPNGSTAVVEEPGASVDTDEATEESSEDVEITGEFQRELRTVEEEVNHLKERVFRSKATLQLLKELVIEGATVGSRVILWHVNKMGGAYTMESIQYFLDGKNVYTKVDPGGQLDSVRELKVHEQTVPPGTHSLQVHMVLRGNGFGIFSYLRTYQFKVTSSYSFKVEDGKATVVRVIANERGGIRRTFVDKPNVHYEERVENLRNE